MDKENIIFYLIIALSVVGSIVKALKKKPVEKQPVAQPRSTGDVLKKLVEEWQDDYIPKNMESAQKPASPSVVKQQPPKSTLSAKTRNVEKGYETPEVKKRVEDFPSKQQPAVFEPIVEPEDPFLGSLDLSESEELKKAVVYSEILRTKF
jgi:hypothetical protein